MRCKIIAACIMYAIGCLISSSPVSADETKGEINWVGGYISGIGQGTSKPSGNKAKDRINAVRAAVVLAHRALAETINGVRVDSNTLVKNMALEEDVVRTRVEGIVKGAQKISEHVEYVDGYPMATVEMRICLVANAPECKSNNALMSVLPVEKMKEPPYVPTKSFPATPPPVEKKDPAQGAKSQCLQHDSSKPVTGIVLNLDGRFFERELLPVVVTEGGEKYQTVYSAKSVKPNVIRTYGVVRYADTLDQAVKNPQVGNNAMVICALDVTKENMIVIRPEGARLIRETTSHGNDYLSEAKVVISSK